MFEADVFVIAAGSWTPKLLPELPISVQPVAARLHYLMPPDPGAYSFPRLPPFFVMDTHFYGFPVHWRGCVKVADDATGEPFDPDREREHDDPAALAKLREFLRRHMPDLSEAEVAYSKTCTYAMTPDTDFVIDYVPNRANAIVAAGFSGHGFKFGILIGQVLADLAMHGTTRWDLTSLSSWTARRRKWTGTGNTPPAGWRRRTGLSLVAPDLAEEPQPIAA